MKRGRGRPRKTDKEKKTVEKNDNVNEIIIGIGSSGLFLQAIRCHKFIECPFRDSFLLSLRPILEKQ